MKNLTLLLIAAASLLTAGCKTAKKSTPPALPIVPIETKTDTKIIHTERIDTVYIQVPEQTAERTTPNKTSHLETDYAQSDARINPDGTLTHTLHNKAAKRPVPIKNTTDTVYLEKSIDKPVPVRIPVEIERNLTWWQKSRLDTWGWIATALLLCVGWILRRPIITLARRLLTKNR